MNQKDQIVVCIDDHFKSSVLLRVASKKSKELGIGWTALFVEGPAYAVLDKKAKERILKFLTIAEQMGANVEHIECKSVLLGIVNYIKNSFKYGERVSHLIIGSINKEGFFAELRASLAENIMRELRKFPTEVLIIPLADRQYTSSWFERLKFGKINLRQIFFSLLAVFMAFIASELVLYSAINIDFQFQLHHVNAFFLIASIIIAIVYGLLPALFSAIISFSVIDYFYTKPYYSFGIDNYADGLSLTIYLTSSIVISIIGAYSRSHKRTLINKENRTQSIYKIYQLANSANTSMAAIKIMHKHLGQLLNMEIAFFLPESINPNSLSLQYPENIKLSKNDSKSLLLCWNEIRTSGLGTTNKFNSSWRFEPLATTKSEIGVIAVKIPENVALDISFGRFFSTIADQGANILEKIELTKLMSESHIKVEREKLRSMLLSSVSHDLKTPLASIIGGLSIYKRMKKAGKLDDETEWELIDTALTESQRLDSFICNILDMTRIESGDISFNIESIEIFTPVQNVIKRMKHKLKNYNLTINKDDKEIFVQMDKMLTEQVLQNILDNASKYSPKNTTITIEIGQDKDRLFYKIIDEGTGIPEENLESVFDKYERLKFADSKVAGTGLGLAISKSVMQKQGGDVIAQNHRDGGAEFIIYFNKNQSTDQ